MELQNFINNNCDYLNIIKQNKFKIKKLNKYNLILITNNYENPLSYNNPDDYWKMYCRGAIINTKNNKVVCLPPVKSIEINNID